MSHINPIESHSNWGAALVVAACAASDAMAAERQAGALTVFGQIENEEKGYSGWVVSLGAAGYTEHPKSYRSWMSMGKLRSMVTKEKWILSTRLKPLQSSYNYYANTCNSCYADERSDPSHYGSYASEAASAWSHMQQLSGQMNPLKAILASAANLTTSSGVKKAYAAMAGAGDICMTRQMSRATIPELQSHIVSLVNQKASQCKIMAAQQILAQTKTSQQAATNCADSGVQAAQQQIQTDANEEELDLSLVNAVNASLQATAVNGSMG